MSIRSRFLSIADRRRPDFVVGGAGRPYLMRWWVIPRNPIFNVYLHCFMRSDDDRALHTHPYLFNISWMLEGNYREWFRWLGMTNFADRTAGQFKFRWGPAAHRIELTSGPCWTLFITGPRVRSWGFLCPRGFVHWRDFTDTRDAGAVGKGCDQ